MAAEMHKLSNGVTVLLDHNPNTQGVAVGYGVRVGARYETDKENGLTHFLEHMAFKGKTPEETLGMMQAIESAGGAVNAYTSRDVTFYYAAGLAEAFDTFNGVMSNVALNSVIPAKELENERGVIIGEIGQSLDDPDSILNDIGFATAYPDQALGKTILGPKENIERFQRANFRNFLKKHYHGGNVVASIAGNFDPQHVLKAVESASAHLPAGKRSKFQKAAYQGGFVHQKKAQDQLHLSLNFNASSLADSADSRAETIMGAILGGGMSSRLFQEIREKRGLGYSIHAGTGAMKDTGLFYVDAVVNPQGAEALFEATAAELHKLVQDGVSDDELARIKAKLKTQLALSEESTQGSMRSMFHTYDSFDSLKTSAETLAEFDAVTKDDVKAAAERVFSTAPVLATVGPGRAPLSRKKVEKALKL